MGTKYRRDLTAEDFRIVARFKNHLHRLGINKMIDLGEGTVPIAYEQNWYLSGTRWKENRKKECKNERCYFLTMRDFRAVVRSIARDIDTVTEGLVLDTLKRFSLIRFTKDGHWKWQTKNGDPCLILGKERLSPEGTFQKRNPDTAGARLDIVRKTVAQVMEDNECSYETAFNMALLNGLLKMTAGEYKKLVLEAETATTEKKKRRAEIDEKIRQRQPRKMTF